MLMQLNEQEHIEQSQLMNTTVCSQSSKYSNLLVDVFVSSQVKFGLK